MIARDMISPRTTVVAPNAVVTLKIAFIPFATLPEDESAVKYKNKFPFRELRKN